jgi:probable rRNA maturation factor
MDIAIADQQDASLLDDAVLRDLCRRLLAQHGVEAGLSVCLVDNEAIRRLNARFRQEDEVTDVLAFPLDDELDPADGAMLGEVVVSVEKALDEAEARGIPAASELALYVAHGVLHLLGYDDHEPEDARRMREAEAKALAEAGLEPVAVDAPRQEAD